MKEQKTILSAAMLADALSDMDPDTSVRVALGDYILPATSVGCLADDDGTYMPVIVVPGIWNRFEGGDGEA